MTRTVKITFTFDGDVDEAYFVGVVEEDICQLACDFAASLINDEYRVDLVWEEAQA